MDLNKKVLATVKKYNLIKPGDRVILGFSGGPDSLMLFTALKELTEAFKRTRGKFGLDADIYPVHVNHCMRPGAAERDQEFCERLCREWSGEPESRIRELRTFKVDCPKLAEQRGMTPEEAGRFARYEAFKSLARELGDRTVIAVAQNADDQAETLLFRLIRGTGTDGLGGIAYSRREHDDLTGRDIPVIRPILGIYRVDIEEYLKARGLEPCRDLTNLEPDYARNRIRLELLPYLREYNPNITAALDRLAEIAAEDKEYLNAEAARALERVMRSAEAGECDASGQGVTTSLSLDIPLLGELHAAIRSRVYAQALSQVGMRENITREALERIDDIRLSENHPMAETRLTGGFAVIRVKKELRFLKDFDKK